jgi:hypothetical protein
LPDKEFEEKFVKGSGNGGQKINKVKNCVQLTHIATGIQVSVQDTRSLEQNRKIARKRLFDKVEYGESPAESKIGKKVAKMQKRKQKARARSKKKYAKNETMDSESAVMDADGISDTIIREVAGSKPEKVHSRAFSTMTDRRERMMGSQAKCRSFHNFRGDNSTGMHADILQAMATANEAPSSIEWSGYGSDPISSRLHAAFADAFGLDGTNAEKMQVFPVATGSAANGLAMSVMTAGNPLHSIACHETAHVYTDELNAASFFCGGVQLVPIRCAPEQHGKMTADDVRDAIQRYEKVMFGGLTVLSLTQATESGTVYTKPEVEELSGVAREHGMLVHMDGARIANAVHSQPGVSAGELTWEAGVDCLSFGGCFPPHNARTLRSQCSLVVPATLARCLQKRHFCC